MDSQIDKLEKWVKSVDEKLANHLVHLTAEITEIKTNMDWIKYFFFLVSTISITAIVGSIFALILK